MASILDSREPYSTVRASVNRVQPQRLSDLRRDLHADRVPFRSRVRDRENDDEARRGGGVQGGDQTGSAFLSVIAANRGLPGPETVRLWLTKIASAGADAAMGTVAPG
jgi:hypothetical protein